TEIGQSVHVKDIKIDKTKVKVEAEEDETVAIDKEPRAEEVEVKPVVEAVAVEGEEAAKAEGATPSADDKSLKPETAAKPAAKPADKQK
ncbi:MAG: hypothetical protein Q7S70_01940, partial [bacterium]|nr:hypothetical protein [bacterium]